MMSTADTAENDDQRIGETHRKNNNAERMGRTLILKPVLYLTFRISWATKKPQRTQRNINSVISASSVVDHPSMSSSGALESLGSCLLWGGR
jgi:hypothetical protein